jgi:Uma2 family endonuclease
MVAATTRRATYEDLLAVPDRYVAEILDGELVTSPRPAPRHADAAAGLLAELRPPFGRRGGGDGGWLILFEPELHMADDVLVPDVAGWKRERLPQLPDAAFFTLAPDWACEVLSPSTQAVDRTRKLPVYAREGVTHVWLVDPLAETLEVFRLDGATYRLVQTAAGDVTVRGEPFEAFELRLPALWGR